MSTTLQQTINWAQTYINYSPLTAGTGNEPAISVGNQIQNTITNFYPWPWNRAEDSSTTTTAGTQDYTVALTTFKWLEKVSLTDASSNIFEVKDVKNTNSLGKSSIQARPNAACVTTWTPGTSIVLRFMSVPDATYTATLTYQQLVTPFSGLSANWTVPDNFQPVYESLFLAEAYQMVGDERAQLYRQRGMAQLISMVAGLAGMDINAFLAQYDSRNAQQAASQLKTQQGIQARSI